MLVLENSLSATRPLEVVPVDPETPQLADGKLRAAREDSYVCVCIYIYTDLYVRVFL